MQLTHNLIPYKISNNTSQVKK